MIVARNVFQAKYGRGGELVALLKELAQLAPELNKHLKWILTDLSGPFYTVVTESEFASLEEWQRLTATIYAHPDFRAWFARMQELVDHGRREFYNVEG